MKCTFSGPWQWLPLCIGDDSACQLLAITLQWLVPHRPTWLPHAGLVTDCVCGEGVVCHGSDGSDRHGGQRAIPSSQTPTHETTTLPRTQSVAGPAHCWLGSHHAITAVDQQHFVTAPLWEMSFQENDFTGNYVTLQQVSSACVQWWWLKLGGIRAHCCHS